MNEAFLQYVWQYQLLSADRLCTTSGELITVKKVGTLNRNAGPDFLNAILQIGDTTWAGDIEIHCKASDWFRHHHDSQKSYNSVILHAVGVYDTDIRTENGITVPTLVLPILPHITRNYKSLHDISKSIACGSILRKIERERINIFIDKLAIERLEYKVQAILSLYTKNIGDWRETLYQLIARYFGCNTNSDGFELLAKSIPLKILEKIRDNPLQIRALIFGQANIWSKDPDEYEQCLHKEYLFLQKKYQLTPMSPTWWRFSKMRPRNFPSFRLAQFASLIESKHDFTTMVCNSSDSKDLRSLFSVKADTYWESHYILSKPSQRHSTDIGDHMIDTLLINTVVPFLFAYGKKHNDEKMMKRSYQFLTEIKAERNSIIDQWTGYGIQVLNARDSQALIQLYNRYCRKGNCLHCAFGHLYLKRKEG